MTEIPNKILFVEDNPAIRDLFSARLSENLTMSVLNAASMQEALAIISDQKQDIFLTVLDLNLPDSPNGEIVDVVIAEGLPVIVLTGSMKESMHDIMAAKPIIDYVIKRNMSEMSYLISLIDRIRKNVDTKVLIVDDNDDTRHFLRLLLTILHFEIYDAASASEGLEVLKQHPDIKLVITDYFMPEMNGIDFTLQIREKYTRDQLSIIAISSLDDNKIPAKLLKSGANDFIFRPFLNEEFFSRVGNAVDAINNFEYIRNTAIRDHLTGMYNRKYLYEAGGKLYNNAKRKNLTLAVVMLDIDFFKKINDTWGHHIGDLALKHVADILEEHVRSSDLLARVGGEEFCVIATNIDTTIADVVFNRIRNKIENTPLITESGTVNITMSIGVTLELHNSLEEMIQHADRNLFSAKESGRNQVIID